MMQPQYVPTIGKIKELGCLYTIEGKNLSSGLKYTGYLNSSSVAHATRMICFYEDMSIQVAHKEPRLVAVDNPQWQFKGFGVLTDEAHLLRLMAGPNREAPGPTHQREYDYAKGRWKDDLGDYLNNT